MKRPHQHEGQSRIAASTAQRCCDRTSDIYAINATILEESRRAIEQGDARPQSNYLFGPLAESAASPGLVHLCVTLSSHSAREVDTTSRQRLSGISKDSPQHLTMPNPEELLSVPVLPAEDFQISYRSCSNRMTRLELPRATM